ncbi:hypothetical protein AOG27_15810 [Pseudoalteromonas lipolytica]|uniref:Uncharacterized protein n=1 Tax=Pseudoalteromonas lipolytica TaxID=570156 RepID=A0A0P7EGN4_9GAMM|nr:hypothetical protein AOG27_15810 [Pseudoalteromonas lipolytica]
MIVVVNLLTAPQKVNQIITPTTKKINLLVITLFKKYSTKIITNNFYNHQKQIKTYKTKT